MSEAFLKGVMGGFSCKDFGLLVVCKVKSERRIQKSLQTPGIRKTQEGCGGLRGENPGAFPKAGPTFQQPFSLPENAQTLAGIAFRAAGKSVTNFPAASKFAGKIVQQGSLGSHSLLEFSDGSILYKQRKMALSYRQPFQSSVPEMTVEIKISVLSGVISEAFVVKLHPSKQ